MPIWDVDAQRWVPKKLWQRVSRRSDPRRRAFDDENLLRCCRGTISWRQFGWPQGLRWRLETSDVHMQALAMTQPRAKNSLTSIWRPVCTSSRCAARPTYTWV